MANFLTPQLPVIADILKKDSGADPNLSPRQAQDYNPPPQEPSSDTGPWRKDKDVVENIVPLPSEYMNASHQKRVEKTYLRHMGPKIRKDLELPADATDEEAIQVYHKMMLPDASQEELGQVLSKLYPGYKRPKAPGEIQKGATGFLDFPFSLLRSLIALPVGAGEAVVGGLKQLPLPNVDPTSPYPIMPGLTSPSEKTKEEGKELLQKAKEHAIEGGIFGAALLLTGGVGGLIEGGAVKIGLEKGIPTLVKNVLAKPVAEMVTFGGTERVMHKAVEGGSPKELAEALQAGLSGDVKFGVALGTIGAGLGAAAKLFKAGSAIKNADTLGKAKKASTSLADAFEPTMIHEDVRMTGDPHQLAKEFLEKIGIGKDVLESKSAEADIKIIVDKINEYRNPTGEKFWKATLTNGKKYTEHTVSAPTHEGAIAELNKLRKTGDYLSGEIEPTTKPIPSQPKVTETDVANIENLSDEQLIARHQELKPEAPLPETIPEVKATVREETVKRAEEVKTQVAENPVYPLRNKKQRAKIIEQTSRALNIPKEQLEKNIRDAQNVPEPKIREGATWIRSSKGPLPERTLMLGRGAHGLVRVEFPDKLHADLYALQGRTRKLTMGSLGREEQKALSDKVTHSIANLAKSLGISETEVRKMASSYREKINEMIKGHPTYEESGKVIQAPPLRDVASGRKFEGRSKILGEFELPDAQVSIVGIGPNIPTKQPYWKVFGPGISGIKMFHDKIFHEELGLPQRIEVHVQPRMGDVASFGTFKMHEVREGVQAFFNKTQSDAFRRLEEKYQNILVRARPIGQWKLIDPTQRRNSALLDKLASTPHYEQHLNTLQNIFDDTLKSLGPEFQNVKLHGLTTGSQHLGLNIFGALTIHVPHNMVVVSPWLVWRQSKGILAMAKWLNPGAKEYYSAYAETMMETLYHEIAHQKQWKEKGIEKVIEGIRKTLGDAKQKEHVAKILAESSDDFFLTTEKQGYELYKDFKETQGIDLLDTTGSGLAGDERTGFNQALSQRGKERRVQPEETVPQSGIGETPEFSPGTGR